jgi:hypothetical protein
LCFGPCGFVHCGLNLRYYRHRLQTDHCRMLRAPVLERSYTVRESNHFSVIRSPVRKYFSQLWIKLS